ncbi:type VII secretion protein EccCb [Mycobacterium sp.]|uniref:type VII secretion protein EccCb n=1 Tax=Mycobacterium sp. TaxID=1785 RepID=UPI00260F0E21|nr:type VII secretion protein EccCb [Mycobacterium sp.]
MTQVLVPAAAQPPIVVEAPPDLPSPASPGLVARLLPVALSVASMGVMTAAFASGTAMARHPMFLAFPMMMLVSTVAAGLTGRHGRPGWDIDADRGRYLGYLKQLSQSVSEIAMTQRAEGIRSHPDPDMLWTLIGGTRMWQRRSGDAEFCRVRVGIGTQPLACRLVAPPLPAEARRDPVTETALRRFLHTHSAIDGPVTIDLREGSLVTIDGERSAARGLLRAMICQLAVLHGPDQVRVVAAVSDPTRGHWEWLKWLPHNQHPAESDSAGPVRMVYSSAAQAQRAIAGVQAPRVVVVADLIEGADAIIGATTIAVGAGGDGAPPSIRNSTEAAPVSCPDRMDPVDALVCARRLAGHRLSAAGARRGDPGWAGLIGLNDVERFDPANLWRREGRRDRLRVPIGTTMAGAPLELDIKEPAANGMGPHGLCIGATGSGKSELLRTIALGMMARNSPDVLNLLLVDFKGGATFLDYAQAPHVSAVITNLADDAPLVARMRDSLAGEMNRRQQLLRTAGCVSVESYERARRTGAPPATLPVLPTLFVIVDEFSELLSQHPDFADMFVAIGRLGRSLGVHLLLASQRLDEGRLRGLDAHLSYRLCLKTLSAAESRTVLGNLDAYELPAAPGAGFLRTSDGEPIRFQATLVSGPLRTQAPPSAPAAPARPVQVFTTRVSGAVRGAQEASATPTPSVSRAVLDRLRGHGPPAHRVWLPPLGPAPELRTLLGGDARTAAAVRVPIGIVDRPFEQCRTPLTVDLSGAAGNVAIVGGPQSGKSTALRTLITALAATHDPSQVQFYCLDFGGGTLASARTLPHVGAVAGRAEPRLIGRIVAECESVVRRREATFREHAVASMADYRRRRTTPGAATADPFGDVFLVIDGWATVRQEFETLETSITTVAAQGLSFGVHVVLSASRWADIRPSLRDQLGTRIELRLGDPADSELDRKAAQHVPHDSPGRGLSRDGLHMVIALPVAEVPAGGPIAPPIPLLPMRIDRETLMRGAGVELDSRVLLGVRERELHTVTVEFEQNPHLLILGGNGCGKTATLRTLCRELVRTKTPAQAQLLIVDFRRALLGVVESEHLRGYAISPAALGAVLPGLLDLLRGRMPPPDASQAQLRTGSWWSGPDLYVVVDGYDLVATQTGNTLAPIVEFLPYAQDLGLHLVVARRGAGAERAMFDPLLEGLRDLGCASLIMSGAPFGPTRPVQLPPGRGVLSTGTGSEDLVQVAWSPP